ncbi:hypothetical protein OROMI_009617 [Orobanche minor]
MPIQLCEGYHASLVKNESSSIGSYVDKGPERASFALKGRRTASSHVCFKIHWGEEQRPVLLLQYHQL